MSSPEQRLREALRDYGRGDLAADDDWTPDACAIVLGAADIEVPEVRPCGWRASTGAAAGWTSAGR